MNVNSLIEILIALPKGETFDLWKNYENLPHFMTGLTRADRIPSLEPRSVRLLCVNLVGQEWFCDFHVRAVAKEIFWETQGYPGSDQRVALLFSDAQAKESNAESKIGAESKIRAEIKPVDPGTNENTQRLLEIGLKKDLRKFQKQAEQGALRPPERLLNLPEHPDAKTLESAFEELARYWRADTSIFSTASLRAMHPAHDQIVELGMPVVPLILRHLQRYPVYWFWTLTAITGENPAKDTTTFHNAKQAWLDWSKKHYSRFEPNKNMLL